MVLSRSDLGGVVDVNQEQNINLFSVKLREQEFSLDENFLKQFEGKQPEWGPVGLITYKRTYARTKSDNTTEEYWETCRRVIEGTYQIQQRHCAYNHLPWISSKAQGSAQEMYQLMWDFKFLPPGRGLWMMGTDFIRRKGGAALNNCAYYSTANIDRDFTAPFCFLMDMSMLGVGVGSDIEGAGKVIISEPLHCGTVWTVKDSREGWVDAVRELLNSYLGVSKGRVWKWRYSAVRPRGAPVKGFGGVSSGPESLKVLLEKDIPSILNPLIGKPITRAAIVDLFNVIGKCVVSGGIRRTAEIMFGDMSEEFLSLKDPEFNGDKLRDFRWASNNSVKVIPGSDYRNAAAITAKNGEPGYFWLENAQKYGRMIDPPNFKDHRATGGNPCLEQTLETAECCCLVETFPARHDSYEDYQRTLKYAYLYAKSVTLVPTHNPETNRVMMRNRRIGLSQSGIVQSFGKIGRREHMRWCDSGYKYIDDLDRIYSEWLCVPRSIKRTSVKPSGSVSKLVGSTSGIHYPPAEFYLQRIRIADTSPLLPKLDVAGYPIEDCKYAPNTKVVEFPVHVENFTRAEHEVSMWEQLSNAAQMQRWWADNQVSCTVKFNKSEGKDIPNALELYDDQLKGISFLPHEHGYDQAPWEEITKEEYESRISVLGDIDLTESNTHEVTDKFCDGDSCTIPIQ